MLSILGKGAGDRRDKLVIADSLLTSTSRMVRGDDLPAMAPTGGEDRALPFAKLSKIEESAHLRPPILAGHENDPAGTDVVHHGPEQLADERGLHLLQRWSSPPPNRGARGAYDPGVNAAQALSLIAVAEEDRKALRGPNADAAMARLEASYPDLVKAIELLLTGGRVDDAIRLASTLVPFWMATKRIAEGDGWFTRALGAGGASDAARASALHEQGYLIFWAGQYDRSARLSNEAVALGRTVGDMTVVSLALGVLARIALETDLDEAKRLLREAIAVTEGTDDTRGRSSAMHVLGVALQMSGELEEARKVMSDRIAIGRATGNDFLIEVESGNLSMVERQLGNLERAEALARESLDLVTRRRDELAIPWTVNGLAAVTAARGDLDRAAVLVGFAEAGIERAGGEWPPDERRQYEGTLETLRAGLASDALDRARAAGAAMSTAEGLEYALSAPAPAAPAG